MSAGTKLPYFSIILNEYEDLSGRLFLEERKRPKNKGKAKTMDNSLLQISASDTVFIYDLSYATPTEVAFVNNSSFFDDAEYFPALNLQQFWSQQDMTRSYIWNEVKANLDRSIFVFSQKKDCKKLHESR